MRTLLCAIALVACGHHEDPARPAGATFEVTSTAFAAGAAIPIEHTCEGADVAPALAWSGAPAATTSFAVIVDDPDAPSQTWVHWVVVNLPGNATSVPAGATMGTNDFGKTAWGGPCPPSGRHRYFFKVYALDAAIGRAGITKPELVAAMSGHILAQGELMGTYQKTK